MIKKIIALTILLMLFAAAAFADFKIQVTNPTDLNLVYHIYWVDHDWPNSPFPVNVMGGEIEAGKSHNSEYNYKEGTYTVEWYQDGTQIALEEFTVTPGTAMVVVEFDCVTLCGGA
jgi:hypothetical protein